MITDAALLRIAADINGVICSTAINRRCGANSLNINGIGIRVAIDRSNTGSGLHRDDIGTAVSRQISHIGVSAVDGKVIIGAAQRDIQGFNSGVGNAAPHIKTRNRGSR